MTHTPGKWRLGNNRDTVVTDPDQNTGITDIHYYGGKLVAESIFSGADRCLIASAPDMQKQLNQLAEVIARNLTAWDTSKDKTQGLWPEVYLSNKHWYKKLTGEEYTFSRAIKKFNI
ncbi:hypothetical protein MKY15_19915 [Sporosarcina sp. FSL K6-1540]|uniref:hypothetical protein n=1 Tax=Sporosarcina sp. FSL K6-1540 TaxID=2921555 RepID=UPI00315A878E